MSETYVLEVQDEAAGLLVTIGEGAYRFVATDGAYRPLDGKVYGSPERALRAAYRLYRDAAPGEAEHSLIA